MTTVVGIDPSLTGTGIAILTHNATTGTVQPNLHTIASRGRRSDTWAQRSDRLLRLRNETMALVPRATRLAVIEGPAYAAHGAGTHDRSWYWGKLYDAFAALQIPVAVCSPTSRAKWATDKGNAGKADVAMAVAKLWPDARICGDDQADALCLGSIAGQHLSLPMPFLVLERHKLAISKVQWP